MDDLDFEQLKQELDGVYGSSRYNVDDILREAGAGRQEEDDDTNLEQLMKQLGVTIEDSPSAQEPPPDEEEDKSDDLSALRFAVEQAQGKQQNMVGQEPEEKEPLLAQQEDAFAELFAQVDEIEQREAESSNVIDEPEAEPEETATEPLTVDDILEEQASEPAAEQPQPEPNQKPKKSFFARLFGASDVEYDTTEEQPEPVLPDPPEPEEQSEPEDLDDTTELEAVQTGNEPEPQETQEQPPLEDNGSTISEEELAEFLSSVGDESNVPRTSFEELLRDNGVDLEKPMKQAKKEAPLNEFPDTETTLYVDIPVRGRSPGQVELFDVETALEEDEAENGEVQEEPEPDWMHMSLEQLCSQAPPLEELREEGPVMAREVARQKEWLLERRRIYLESVQTKQEEQAETEVEEQPEEEAEADDSIHAGDELQAMLDGQSDEEREAVFTNRSADKPETEPAGREKKQTANAEKALEDTQEVPAAAPAPEEQPKEQEKEKPKPAKKKKRKAWPKEDVPQDVRRASGSWRRRARKQGRRSVLIAVCTIIAVYISCAADFSILPLPDSMDYSSNPADVLSILLVLQVLAMLAGYDVIWEGIQAAVHLTPNFSTLVDLALALNLVHCVVRMVSEGEEIPYACIAMLALFAQMRVKFSFSCTRNYTFKAAANVSNPIGVFYHDGKNPHIVKVPLENTGRFIRQLVKPDENWKQERILTIFAVIISIVLSAIVCTATGDTGRLPYVLAATVTGACQIALLSAAAMAHKNAVRHMVKNGSIADGRRGARRIASANGVILTDEDLFPVGSVALQRIELRSSLNDVTALAYAAALAGDSPIGRMLAEEVHTRYGSQMTVHHIVQYVSGGIRGQAGGLEVLFGGEAFMAERGVVVSKMPENGLVLAVDRTVAAIFVMEYSVPAALFNAMQMLMERHVAILLHTRNEQVTPKMVEQMYGLRAGTVKLLHGEQDRAVKSPRYTEHDTLCAILIRDGLVPLSDCISTAQAQTRLSWVGTLIGIGASVTCMLLMMYLCYIFVPADARPIRMLIYTVLCFVPIFFLENGVGRN